MTFRKLFPLVAILVLLSLVAAQCVVVTPAPEAVEEPMAEEEEAAEPAAPEPAEDQEKE